MNYTRLSIATAQALALPGTTNLSIRCQHTHY